MYLEFSKKKCPQIYRSIIERRLYSLRYHFKIIYVRAHRCQPQIDNKNILPFSSYGLKKLMIYSKLAERFLENDFLSAL